MAMVRLVPTVTSAATAPTRRMSQKSAPAEADAAAGEADDASSRPQIGRQSEASDGVERDHAQRRRRRSQAVGTGPSRR